MLFLLVVPLVISVAIGAMFIQDEGWDRKSFHSRDREFFEWWRRQ